MSKSPNYFACNHCKIPYDKPQICPVNLNQCRFLEFKLTLME